MKIERAVEPMTVRRFTGCPPTGPDFEFAKRFTHREVLEGIRLVHGRQDGPVRWRTYAPEEAESILRDAGAWDSPNAPGLVAWLRANPGTVLMIAAVNYVGEGIEQDLSTRAFES